MLSLAFVDGSFGSNPPIVEPANGSTFGESGASLNCFKNETHELHNTQIKFKTVP